jgi:hypothetical protein
MSHQTILNSSDKSDDYQTICQMIYQMIYEIFRFLWNGPEDSEDIHTTPAIRSTRYCTVHE